MERRSFLQGAATAACVGAASTLVTGAGDPGAQAAPAKTAAGSGGEPRLMLGKSAGTLRGEMLYRPLGKTGVEVSAIGLGGHHLGLKSVSDDDAVRIIHQALDRGINFLDNSWDYHDGRSEKLVGKALAQGYRQKAFVMTKIDARTKELAKKQLDDSLSRLKVERIDLVQHHEVIRFEDADRVFAEDGANEALVEARRAGKLRYIGYTGHKDPHIHLYMLDVAKQHGFHFDTAQLPLNLMDAHFRSFARLVVPRLVQEGIAVLGMKSLCDGDGVLLKTGKLSADECISYALSLPTSTVICGIDKPEILEQAFRIAKNFKLLDETQVAALLEKTRPLAGRGDYELFKTTTHFDSTAQHPEWLGGDPPQVKKLVPASAG